MEWREVTGFHFCVIIWIIEKPNFCISSRVAFEEVFLGRNFVRIENFRIHSNFVQIFFVWSQKKASKVSKYFSLVKRKKIHLDQSGNSNKGSKVLNPFLFPDPKKTQEWWKNGKDWVNKELIDPPMPKKTQTILPKLSKWKSLNTLMGVG